MAIQPDAKALISQLSSMRLSLHPYFGRTSTKPGYGYGGSWVFAEGEGHFSLGRPLIISLHDRSRRSVIKDLFCYEGSLLLPNRTGISICVSRWLEPIRSRIAEFFPGFGILKAGFYLPVKGTHSHWTIEQINYGDHQRAVMEGLDIRDLDAIVSFIRPAIMEMIDAELSSYQQDGGHYGRKPATAELKERWRDPRPELVELHNCFRHAREEFSLARYDDPALQRYERSEENGSIFIVADDPAIRIELPRSSHEGPELRGGGVWCGEVRCPIDAHELRFWEPSPPLRDANGVDVTTIRLAALVHPFSTLVRAPEVPSEFSERQATVAVEHMRKALLKGSVDRAARSDRSKSGRDDIVVI